MKLWMSGEVQLDISDAYRLVRKEIELAINSLLENVVWPEKSEKWAVIAIIREIESNDYKEVIKNSSGGKVLEFRLRISHADFLVSTNQERVALNI